VRVNRVLDGMAATLDKGLLRQYVGSVDWSTTTLVRLCFPEIPFNSKLSEPLLEAARHLFRQAKFMSFLGIFKMGHELGLHWLNANLFWIVDGGNYYTLRVITQDKKLDVSVSASKGADRYGKPDLEERRRRQRAGFMLWKGRVVPGNRYQAGVWRIEHDGIDDMMAKRVLNEKGTGKWQDIARWLEADEDTAEPKTDPCALCGHPFNKHEAVSCACHVPGGVFSETARFSVGRA